jgi:hypothetical protein
MTYSLISKAKIKTVKDKPTIEATSKSHMTMGLKDKDIKRFMGDYNLDPHLTLKQKAKRMPGKWVDMSAYGGVDKRSFKDLAKGRRYMGTLWTVVMEGVGDDLDFESVRTKFDAEKTAKGLPESSYFKEISRGDTKEKASEVTFIVSLGNIAEKGMNAMVNKVEGFLKAETAPAKVKSSKKQD